MLIQNTIHFSNKAFCLLLFIGTALPFYAQLTSGEITYTSKDWVKFEDEPQRKDNSPEVDSFSVLFNAEHYLSTSKDDEITNVLFADRNSRRKFLCTIYGFDKTVEFTDMEKFTTQHIGDNFNSGNGITYQIIEEPEKIDPESFPKDLMQKIAEDTLMLLSSETKNMLGYNCKKIVLKITNEKTITAWYTTEITDLNDLYNPCPFRIHGFVLSNTVETSRHLIVTEVTSLKRTGNMLENLTFKIPEEYVLDLRSVYLNKPSNGSLRPSSLLPNIVVFNEAQPAIDSMTKEIDQFVRQSFKTREDIPDAYFWLTISLDNTGKITAVRSNPHSDKYFPNINIEKLTESLQKNCTFKPATLQGIPVDCVFKAMFLPAK